MGGMLTVRRDVPFDQVSYETYDAWIHVRVNIIVCTICAHVKHQTRALG